MRRSTGFMRGGRTERKLTEPLGNVVSWFLLVTAGLFALFLVLAPFDSQISVWGFGHGSVCADVSSNTLAIGGTGDFVVHMKPGASSYPREMGLCVDRPTAGQRILVTLTQAPAFALYVALLLLLWQLLRTVGAAGPFDLLVSRRLRFLAWFILAGSLVVAAGQAAARSIFASTVVTDPVPVAGNVTSDLISAVFTPLLIACGLLTLARVIRVGAQMRDDLAGTVLWPRPSPARITASTSTWMTCSPSAA
jgi:hypothetical protein